MTSESIPWTTPTPDALGGSHEPAGHWFSGRVQRQERGLKRLDVLTERLAHALGRNRDDSLVVQAVTEVAMGITIEIQGWTYSKISDASLAITEAPGDIQEMEFDEMWHFIGSKKTKFGSSRPWIVAHGEPWLGWSVVVMLQPFRTIATHFYLSLRKHSLILKGGICVIRRTNIGKQQN